MSHRTDRGLGRACIDYPLKALFQYRATLLGGNVGRVPDLGRGNRGSLAAYQTHAPPAPDANGNKSGGSVRIAKCNLGITAADFLVV